MWRLAFIVIESPKWFILMQKNQVGRLTFSQYLFMEVNFSKSNEQVGHLTSKIFLDGSKF